MQSCFFFFTFNLTEHTEKQEKTNTLYSMTSGTPLFTTADRSRDHSDNAVIKHSILRPGLQTTAGGARRLLPDPFQFPSSPTGDVITLWRRVTAVTSPYDTKPYGKPEKTKLPVKSTLFGDVSVTVQRAESAALANPGSLAISSGEIRFTASL